MPKDFKIFLIFSLFFLLLPFVSFASEKIIFFWGQGCPHCAKVEQYIQKNNLDEVFNIERKEIYFNEQNREDFMRICDRYNIPLEERGVPLAVIDGKCIVGDEPIIRALEAKSQNLTLKETKSFQGENISSSKKITLPLIIGAASVDTINPCAFYFNDNNFSFRQQKKSVFGGNCFCWSYYFLSFIMGLGIYKALASAKFSNWFMKFIAGLAIFVGVLNIKDYFWYGGGGFLMEVPMKWRPKMKS